MALFKFLLPSMAFILVCLLSMVVLKVLWDRKKSALAKWLIWFGFAFSFVCLIASFFALYESYGWYQRQAPKKVYMLRDIQLGWDKKELIFRMGEPSSIVLDVDDQINKPIDRYIYKEAFVMLVDGKVVRIFDLCESGDSFNNLALSFFSVKCHSSVEHMTDILGVAPVISSSMSGTIRMYSYPQYNLSFTFEKGIVGAVQVYDPLVYPDGMKFIEANSDKKDKANK